MATKLQVGDKAPEFTLPDHEGGPVSLTDFKGRKVVVYFYPEDDPRVTGWVHLRHHAKQS